MSFHEKFKKSLRCMCDKFVIFETLEEVECDWGEHFVIQCPNCEELFSVDKKCPAFQSIEELLKININLFSKKEQLNYLNNSHH